MEFRKPALRWADRLVNSLGLSLVRRWGLFSHYIPLRKTLRGARKAKMSVGEYIDWKNNYPGATQETIDRVAAFGVFDQPIQRVCEIGPGSGRYLEKVMARCHPDSYEIYETAVPWKRRLVQLYGVRAQNTDGVSLSSTPDCSVDLVHGHRVFEGLPVITCLRYFAEAARVVRPGGWLVFDVLTEACLTPEMTNNWVTSGSNWIVSMFPKQFLIDLMKGDGLAYVGSFILPMRPALSEYLIFRKPVSKRGRVASRRAAGAFPQEKKKLLPLIPRGVIL
jgi:hypothetical protein